MSDAFQPVENIGSQVGHVKPARIAEMSESSAGADISAQNFSQAIDRVLSGATTRPNFDSAPTDMRSEFSGSGSRDVSDAKKEVSSTVDRSADPDASRNDESLAAQKLHEDRIKTLYLDLTNYQIAWKIAQRVQQDVSQLLRGS